jgi:hypothetical protein
MGILTRRRDALAQGAALLLQKETLGEEELKMFQASPPAENIAAATAVERRPA